MSTPNLSITLTVFIGRGLLIFSNFIIKITTWRPYWIFWFPESNFSSALNMNSNVSSTSLVSLGRSLQTSSYVRFKIAAWWPYWVFWFLDSNFSLALNINSKLQLHIACVYGWKLIDFVWCQIQNLRLASILEFLVFGCQLPTSLAHHSCWWIDAYKFWAISRSEWRPYWLFFVSGL